MKIFFGDSIRLKIDFSMKVLVSFGLRPIENCFFKGLFVFWASGIVEDGAVPVFLKWIYSVFKTWITFSVRVFCFGLRLIENAFFNESVCFFGLKPIENGFFNESVCFFGLRHCGRRRCAIFSFEFVNFLRPELFFNESLCFLSFRAIENWFFNESICFFGLRPFDFFQWKFFFFWHQAYWKLVFQWKCLFFWSHAYWKWIFQWHFLFFRSQPLWKTVLSFFKNEFTVFFKTRINFSMKVFVFWSQAYWKWIFNESVCFFGLKPIENGFFNESVSFFRLRPIQNWFFNESVCFFGVRHCGRRCCAFFDMNLKCFEDPLGCFNESLCFLVRRLLKIDFLMTVFVLWFQAL